MEALDINPWVSIWFSPKKTIAKIAHAQPNYGLWLLSAFAGFLFFINVSQFFFLTGPLGFWGVLLMAILLSPIIGYLYLSIGSAIVFFIGKLMKGKASYKQVRAALAWSYVPLIVNILMWLLLIATFREKTFVNFPGGEMLDPYQVYFVLGFSIVQVVFAIWALVIYLHGLAQVQGYSVIMAIGNVVVATLVGMLIVGMLWLTFLSLWVKMLKG